MIDGMEVDIEHRKPLPQGGARVDVEAQEREWRLDVTRSGEFEVVTTWRAEHDAIVDARTDQEIPYELVEFAEGR